MQVVNLVVVGIVHAGQVQATVAPLQRHHFIHQQAIAHVFKSRHHSYTVVVAQHGIGVA